MYTLADPTRQSRPLRVARKGNNLTYRSDRSALIAYYAAKIGDAARMARKEDAEAAIAALLAEREAAVERLKDTVPKTKRSFAVPRGKRRLKLRRKRLRPRII